MNKLFSGWFLIGLSVLIVASIGVWRWQNRGKTPEPPPHWIKVEATNTVTVTVTNVVTQYVLDIHITSVQTNGTQRLKVRHKLNDASKPFIVEEEK